MNPDMFSDFLKKAALQIKEEKSTADIVARQNAGVKGRGKKSPDGPGAEERSKRASLLHTSSGVITFLFD